MNNTNVFAAILAFLIAYIVYREISSRWKQYQAKMNAEEKRKAKEREIERMAEQDAAERQANLAEQIMRLRGSIKELNEDQASRQGYAATQSANLIQAMERLSKSVEPVAQHGADGTALMAGTVKACEAIAQSTVELRNEVASFAKLIGAPKPEPQYPEHQLLQPNSEEEAALAQDTFERVMTRHIPLDQAVSEAKEAAEKKMMFSVANLESEG